MACKLDEHPLITDINEFLGAGKKYGEIRAFCISNNETVPTRPALSRHSTGCLKLESRRPVPVEGTDDELKVPDLTEVRDLALAEFFKRLKSSPKTVKTSELVPILTQILRAEAGKDKGRDPIDDILAQL